MYNDCVTRLIVAYQALLHQNKSNKKAEKIQNT